jgi:pseudaminic acid synthase
MNQKPFMIQRRRIGVGHPVYIIAELSANHGQKFETAVELVHAAKRAGADAVKLQTYRPESITLDCKNEYFSIAQGTVWDGQYLIDLYAEAYTPWEWQPKLKALADELGLHLFSSPFDFEAVDFLEEMHVPAYKIASFELVDVGLLQKVASTGRPIILSTGMATKEEIQLAVRTLQNYGAEQIALLKCTSAYPASPESMNLRTMVDLGHSFGVPFGLSDHSMGPEAPTAAVALGASIIEKHLTLSRQAGGPDSSFSLEPHEFTAMVNSVRTTEKMIGTVQYGPSEADRKNRAFRRSLFVVEDIVAGEEFTPENVRSIRPGHGLEPLHFPKILGCKAKETIPRGTPLNWKHVSSINET